LNARIEEIIAYYICNLYCIFIMYKS